MQGGGEGGEVKHEWEDLNTLRRSRQCKHCGVVQTFDLVEYDRLYRNKYAWSKAGRCAGTQRAKLPDAGKEALGKTK